MDDFESRLEHQLSGLARVPLAEPEAVGDLRHRARRVRVGRALTSAVALTTAVALIVAVVVVSRSGTSATRQQKLQVAAPDFVLGDIDAVVLSSSFDADGARNPLPTTLAATIARVPGVRSVSAVLDTFAPVLSPDQLGAAVVPAPTIPPRTPVLFSYHQGDELHLTAGRLPEASNEGVVDADVLSRERVALGDELSFTVRGRRVSLKIVGTFDVPGTDLAGIPLAAMSVAHQPPELPPDRFDVKLDPNADQAQVRNAIAAAVGNDYTVVPPSAISFPDQRLAQIEIQHAYWALLSPDSKERQTSGVAHDAQEPKNYQRYSELAKSVELRVENVAFLSPDAASLTFRIYYGGSPSPVISDPQTGTATRVNGHWQLGLGTLCSLAAIVGIKCQGAASGVTITPPNGWQPVATLEPEVLAAFKALTDPNASVDQRVAAIAGGDAARAEIAAGVAADRQYAGKTDFTIAGWRVQGASAVSILFSLQTAGGPSTPWPSTATASKADDGHWYVPNPYACGIAGMAGSGCTVTDLPAGNVTAATAAASP